MIFLTDVYNNYSKIGATIGFKFLTAHLKDDKSISEKELEELLKEYNFDLKSLNRKSINPMIHLFSLLFDQ